MSSSWKIKQIEVQAVDGLIDVVVIVCFEVSADEDGLKGLVKGDTKLLPPNAQSFTNLADVTEAQVVQWVKDALGADGVLRLESALQHQIDSQKVDRSRIAPLPWLPIEGEE